MLKADDSDEVHHYRRGHHVAVVGRSPTVHSPGLHAVTVPACIHDYRLYYRRQLQPAATQGNLVLTSYTNSNKPHTAHHEPSQFLDPYVGMLYTTIRLHHM